MHLHRTLFLAAVPLLLFAAAISGCGPRQFETEGDALRARVLDLETQLQQLQRREAELQAALRQANRARDQRAEWEETDIDAFVPYVVDISIGRLSHVRDTTGDGRPDTLFAFIHPTDSRSRFTQLVGELRLNAVILAEDAEAITVARDRLDPAEVRDAYRSSITGTHYTIETPLTLPDDADLAWLESQRAIVQVTYIDGRTGEQRTAERGISLQP